MNVVDQVIDSPNPMHIIEEHIEMDLDLELVRPHQWRPFHNGNYTCQFGCRAHIYPHATIDNKEITASKIYE